MIYRYVSMLVAVAARRALEAAAEQGMQGFRIGSGGWGACLNLVDVRRVEALERALHLRAAWRVGQQLVVRRAAAQQNGASGGPRAAGTRSHSGQEVGTGGCGAGGGITWAAPRGPPRPPSPPRPREPIGSGRAVRRAHRRPCYWSRRFCPCPCCCLPYSLRATVRSGRGSVTSARERGQGTAARWDKAARTSW